jgi:ubiquinol-cytochrome c reductase cytochrome b subunit
MLAWPWIESWVTKDKREHHLLDRPRNAPTRTAVGVAGVVFYCVMWAAQLRPHRHPLPGVAERRAVLLRFLVIVDRSSPSCRPPRRPRPAAQGPGDRPSRHGDRTHRAAARTASSSRCTSPSTSTSVQLVNFNSPEVTPAQPDGNGHISRSEKLRGRASKFFFEDRVAPVTPSELTAAHAGHHGEIAESQDRESIASH